MPKKKRAKKKVKLRVIVARTMKDDIADLLSGTKALMSGLDKAARKLGYKDAEDMRRSREEGIAKGIYALAKPGAEKEGAE